MIKSCIMLERQIQVHKEISLNLIKILKMFSAFFNIYSLFFFLQFCTYKFTEQPHQLSASVILAGGFTIYKEDIIQRKLSQRLSYQQGPLNLKDHCQVSFIKITNHLEALSYQLTRPVKSMTSHWLQCSVTNCNYCLVAMSTPYAAFNP